MTGTVSPEAVEGRATLADGGTLRVLHEASTSLSHAHGQGHTDLTLPCRLLKTLSAFTMYSLSHLIFALRLLFTGEDTYLEITIKLLHST